MDPLLYQRRWTEPLHPVLAGCIPYMPTFTFAVFCTTLPLWPRKTWPQRMTDLIAWLICVALHDQPLVVLSFAIAYSVWSCLPGSFTPLDLPTHSNFMRKLPLRQPDAEAEECPVCWNDENSVAQLPCGHRVCEGCLHLLGQRSQTGCPVCRKPWFSVRRDNVILAITKGNIALGTVNGALLLLKGADVVQQSQYKQLSFPLVFLCGYGVSIYFTIRQLRVSGEDWWRIVPTMPAWELRLRSFTFVCNVFSICSVLWALDTLSKQQYEIVAEYENADSLLVVAG